MQNLRVRIVESRMNINIIIFLIMNLLDMLQLRNKIMRVAKRSLSQKTFEEVFCPLSH